MLRSLQQRHGSHHLSEFKPLPCTAQLPAALPIDVDRERIYRKTDPSDFNLRERMMKFELRQWWILRAENSLSQMVKAQINCV